MFQQQLRYDVMKQPLIIQILCLVYKVVLLKMHELANKSLEARKKTVCPSPQSLIALSFPVKQ